MNTKKIAQAVAAVAGLTLALTACTAADMAKMNDAKGKSISTSETKPKTETETGTGTQPGAGSGAESDSDDTAIVYDFEMAKSPDGIFSSQGLPFKVQPSKELLAAVPDGKKLAVTSYTVETTRYPTDVCRVDVGVKYAEGGLEALKTAPAELIENTEAAAVVYHLLGDTLKAPELATVKQLPSDDEIQEYRTYITDDFSKLTYVRYCSKRANDDLVSVRFPYTEPEAGARYFARADITVMGSSAMVIGKTEAGLTPAGKWVKVSE
ncbi:hypothetical protein [Microbacterium sp.]|uniref:hypothetical protein n=1 Tax=Microbacterium sp. TaxID=51671 RepID=UPI0033406FE3